LSVGPERAERLAGLVGEEGLDALIAGDLVRPGDSGPDAIADIRWLTGFGGTSGLALVGPEQRVFLTDFRYEQRAEREVDASFERVIATSRLLQALAELFGGRIGYDEAKTSVRSLRKLEEALPGGAELVAVTGLVERLRRTKDPEEIEAIAEAARITDEVYEWLCERGFAGHTEREVALAAEMRMRELGADAPSFSPIVAAGENSALPHHEPSEREIEQGELLLIDMGAVVGGYCSDSTRTFAVGEVGDEERAVYAAVRQAQQAGLDAVRAGVGGREADAASRRPIEEAGHAERYGHGLGHGVGLEVHEAPRLGKTSDDTLMAGDVVTVEPGVYLPGRFGVRIEDLVVVEADGARNLSGFTKDLLTVV
jgi:Xaa-Pro aminopeptidase